ncbi:hypothetical protein [Acinetobacter soli]|uniref:hypothetical protein n=1 Tax=Acinetobacter soli TaxID=487316 RepID=UPI00046955C9|nr:hypothetical protein [Acinetobacter soli]
MKKLLCAGVIGLGLIGCATPSYNYQPQVTNISNPPLNQVATAYVGESLLEQGKAIQADGIRLNQDTSLPKSKYKLTAGTYIKTGENATEEFYSLHKGKDSGKVLSESVMINPNAFQSLIINKNTLKASTIGANVKSYGWDDITFEKTKITINDTNSFQQTLIYNGKVGNKINIGYREFSGDLARTAFTNSVEYDLNESKVIGYKGARLEVISADNQSIKYKVLQNFNQATQ